MGKFEVFIVILPFIFLTGFCLAVIFSFLNPFGLSPTVNRCMNLPEYYTAKRVGLSNPDVGAYVYDIPTFRRLAQNQTVNLDPFYQDVGLWVTNSGFVYKYQCIIENPAYDAYFIVIWLIAGLGSLVTSIVVGAIVALYPLKE